MSDSLRTRGLYSPWNSLGKNTGMGSCFILQGIFLIQGLNPGLPHCRQILYQLSHKGSPKMKVKVAPSCPSLCNSMDYHGVLQARILEWVAFSLLQPTVPTQESNQGLLHCRWILYQLSYQGNSKESESCSVLSDSL